MSETTITWEVEEDGPLYELYIKKGQSFVDFRLFYKEGGILKNATSISIPKEMVKELIAFLQKAET